MPYDRIARGVLRQSRDGEDVCAWIGQDAGLDRSAQVGFTTPYADRPSLDLFWRRIEGGNFFPIEKMAELTSAAFLGVRIECAQCHKHPFDRWTQEDYRGYANIFGRVRFDSSPELTAVEKPVKRSMDDCRRPFRSAAARSTSANGPCGRCRIPMAGKSSSRDRSAARCSMNRPIRERPFSTG